MRAVSRPLEREVDLNDIARGDGFLFVRDGVGVAGRGVAARVAIDDVPATLAAIEHDDRADGARPLAMGVVPFEPGAAGELIIPAMTVVKSSDGRQWITTIDDTVADLDTPPRPQPRAQSFTTEPLTPVDHYLGAVDAARTAVREGRLKKVVIAREIRVSSDEPIDIHAVLLRLRASFGSSFRYSIDGFVGAMPELLVAVEGETVRAQPFAGTTPRTGDPDTDRRAAAELLASEKNQLEHRIVIDTIHDTLLPWCSYLDWEPEPSIVAVANVQHLGTIMEGHLSEPRPNVLELVRALAPTPAVGGSPRDEALALIKTVEGFDRGRYAGSVGWVDSEGDGTWAVALRCAEFSDDRRSAKLVAGGGIVAESEPLAELAETQAKFQAMLSAIVRP
ncbi:MAG TPA: isochorismate synthase [Ilumatobacteraceae bacterium]|jgi:menaquinone-specific isochorismate synthase